MKRSKPRFHKQEKKYSCVPACLRMVLSSFGVEVSEDDLRQLCDSLDAGTDALKAVDAVRSLGFPGTQKHNLPADELKALVEKNNFPIVYINLFPLRGRFEQHALVVLGMNEAVVTVYDPLIGECSLPTEKFITAWRLQRNLAILVSL